MRWYGHVRRMSTSRTALRWLEWKPSTARPVHRQAKETMDGQCQRGCRSQRIYTEGDWTISTVPGQKFMEKRWNGSQIPPSPEAGQGNDGWTMSRRLSKSDWGCTLKEIKQSALFLDRSQWKNFVTEAIGLPVQRHKPYKWVNSFLTAHQHISSVKLKTGWPLSRHSEIT